MPKLMTLVVSVSLVAAASLVGSMAVAQPLSAATPRALYALDRAAPAYLLDDVGILRTDQRAAIELDLAVLAKDPPSLALALPDGRELVAYRERVATPGAGTALGQDAVAPARWLGFAEYATRGPSKRPGADDRGWRFLLRREEDE